MIKNYKYAFASFFLILVVFFAYSCSKAFVMEEEISTVEEIALVEFKVNKSSMELEHNMKYLNTGIYAEYIKSNFVRFFNSANSNMKIISLNEALEEETLKSLKGFYSEDPSNVLAKATIDLSSYSKEETNVLASKLNTDGYLSVYVDNYMWGQSLNVTFRLYNNAGTLLWSDTHKASSSYIMKDVESPYTGEFEVFGKKKDDKDARLHQDELYIILEEAASNASYEISKRKDEIVE